MNFLHNSAIVGALRASALAPPGSPPRRTSASQSCALTRACSTVRSPYSPSAGLRGWPEFVRYWSLNTRRPVGLLLHDRKSGGEGRSVSGGVDAGGGLRIKKKKK